MIHKCTECEKELTKGDIVYMYCDPRLCKFCNSRLLFKCLSCNETRFSREGILDHIKYKCEGTDYFQCPECEFQTSDISCMKVHIQMHMPLTEMDYDDCPICCKLVKHLNIHLVKSSS